MQSRHLELITLRKGKVLVAPIVSFLLIIACWSTWDCVCGSGSCSRTQSPKHLFLIRYVDFMGKICNNKEEDTTERLMEGEKGITMSVYVRPGVFGRKQSVIVSMR